eukprot:6292311-Alexandrium_andersonii.AAC.1
MGHGAKGFTRRDYVFASPLAAAAVVSIKTLPAFGLDVHLPVVVTIKLQLEEPCTVHCVPDAFARPDGVAIAEWRQAIEKEANV